MNRHLLLAALLFIGSASATMAQQSRYDYPVPTTRYSIPGPGAPGPDRFDTDRRQDLFQVRQLDRIVNLTGGQKRDLLRMENYYDREMNQASRNPRVQQQLAWQKSQDVLSILSPAQRDRLFAYEQYRAYNQGGYAVNRGNSGRDWTPPTGRRW